MDENVLFERLMSTLASSGDDDKLYEFLEKIMESLMSKEVLEGPMRELKEKVNFDLLYLTNCSTQSG